MQVTSPDTLEKKECFSGTRGEAIAILVYVIGERGLIKKGVSPYTECCSLNSLYLTVVAELNNTMASKYFSPPTLLKDKYSTWKKEMQIWEMATSLEKTKRAPIVFLSMEGKARETILELDTAVLNSEDGMKNLYEKLDTLEDINQSAFQAYEIFEGYRRPPETS